MFGVVAVATVKGRNAKGNVRMSLQTGYLLIADITGYTGYLTRSELEHANPIIRSLLEAIVGELKDPMKLRGLEGDAGIRSYALFSEDAFQAMGINSELMQYSAQFGHFGDVPMWGYDLAAAWQRYREIVGPVRVTDEDAVFTTRHVLKAPPVVAWDPLCEASVCFDIPSR